MHFPLQYLKRTVSSLSYPSPSSLTVSSISCREHGFGPFRARLVLRPVSVLILLSFRSTRVAITFFSSPSVKLWKRYETRGRKKTEEKVNA